MCVEAFFNLPTGQPSQRDVVCLITYADEALASAVGGEQLVNEILLLRWLTQRSFPIPMLECSLRTALAHSSLANDCNFKVE